MRRVPKSGTSAPLIESTRMFARVIDLRLVTSLMIGVCFASAGAAWAADQLAETPEEIQGEYLGDLTIDNVPVRVGVQVIARGGDAYHAVGYVGGLPGDGWGGTPKHESDGFMTNGQVEFSRDGITSTLRGGVLTITQGTGQLLGQLKKIKRESSTMGAKPPEGAVVLFDGTSVEQFEVGKLTEDKLLAQGAVTKQKFGSYKLHMEFMLPFMPQAAGQGRGNSGCYNQGRYEVQILDSFGLTGENNECGGIYTIKAPTANLCYPPLSWQTYDITFTAAKYDADGKKTANA